MYQSQEYLEIGGKLITSPYKEDDQLYGVSLHKLICQLHASGASSVTDFQSVILTSIETSGKLKDMDKAVDIFKQVMADLNGLGVIPKSPTH
ncbi:hypothetical protein MTBPR1_90141 [Candidatus Terasakiella magnetica]|uniref:Uncharacterized protein n=1 Tax=Candidatus Terasakiella magnetica TaxID=1867952 RepID=A0A1C3RLY6_9PROT|nr:hypothetical protein [Candidatus Terasakiella magnetica]SCA58294.1 hypothetical protein MTBPR1_90141 [Candidatus Terasakiella magnetica]